MTLTKAYHTPQRGFENTLPTFQAKLPVRATKDSAGYDFFSPLDVLIPPHETIAVRTGISAYMAPGEVLLLFIRSSLGGIKPSGRQLRIVNGTGVIDSDFYPNEILVFLKNEGSTNAVIEAGERFVQGIFTPFLLVDGDSVENLRSGGFGSTGTQG